MGIASVGSKPCLTSSRKSQIPDHPLAADIADQFSSQQVKLLAVIASCVSPVLRLNSLHLCKQLFPDDCRTTALNADVAVLLGMIIPPAVCSCSCFIEHKNAGVLLIAEYLI